MWETKCHQTRWFQFVGGTPAGPRLTRGFDRRARGDLRANKKETQFCGAPLFQKTKRRACGQASGTQNSNVYFWAGHAKTFKTVSMRVPGRRDTYLTRPISLSNSAQKLRKPRPFDLRIFLSEDRLPPPPPPPGFQGKPSNVH